MKKLIAIIVVGAALRFALVAWFHGRPLEVYDERDYERLATSLVETGRFAAESGTLISLRPPLYPGIMAAVYHVAGVGNHTALRVVQVLLSLATVLLVYQIVRDLYDERTALWAAGIASIYPSLVAATCFLLTETLFAFWLALFARCVQRFLTMPSLTKALSGGAVLALAALTRSIVWLFPPFLFLFLLATTRNVSILRRVGLAAASVVAFSIVLAPWAVRNSRLHETFVAVDVMGGRNFMMGNYEHTPLYRAWDAISITGEKSWHHVLAAETPHYSGLTQGQIDKLALRRGLEFVAAHPGLTVQRCVIKFFNFWQLEREVVAGASRGYWGVSSQAVTLLLAGVIFTSYAVVLLSGILGLLLIPASDPKFSWFVLLLVAFICGVHTAVFGHSRYHLPLIPLIGIYSAATMANFRSIWAKRGSTMFRVAAAACLIFITSWVWEVVAIDLKYVRQLFS